MCKQRMLIKISFVTVCISFFFVYYWKCPWCIFKVSYEILNHVQESTSSLTVNNSCLEGTDCVNHLKVSSSTSVLVNQRVFCSCWYFAQTHTVKKSRRISALLRSQLTFLFDASLNPQLLPLEFYTRPANRRHFGGNVTEHCTCRFAFFFSSFFFSCLMKHVWPSLTRIDSAWHLDATWDSKHMLQSTLLRTAVRTHTRTWADEDFICAASHERKPSSRASSALFRATR